MDYERVMLVRAPPGCKAAVEALRLAIDWANEPRQDLIFFQGPGLAHALEGDRSVFVPLAGSDLELRVCRAGWRRRQERPLAAPFVEGSLIQFWDSAINALEVHSFGAGPGA